MSVHQKNEQQTFPDTVCELLYPLKIKEKVTGVHETVDTSKALQRQHSQQ